jgi:hypothetical protein
VYQPHPSQILSEIFRAKPYQGARPENARFVFVGLDANYDAQIESSPIFQRVLEYHEDGVAFWRGNKKKVHHPFLLDEYTGDGQRYHRNFARTGFGPDDACHISFVELLHVPTVGRNQLVAKDLDSAHLDKLNELIRSGARRNVFLSDKVIRLMIEDRRDSGRFDWLPEPIANQVLPLLHQVEETKIFQHLHFANFGVFEARMKEEAAAIAGLRASPHVKFAHACTAATPEPCGERQQSLRGEADLGPGTD